MPFFGPMPTTRRGRFLWRKARYTLQAQRLKSWQWDWVHSDPGHSKRHGKKSHVATTGRQLPCDVSSASYNASPLPLPVGFGPYVVSQTGQASPPHVKITGPLYLLFRAEGNHQSFPLLRYHAKRVKAVRRRSKVKRTKRERQITGANWHYFREGYFPDWDILGRHPNMTDFEAGLPPGTTIWPEPLGY